MNDDVTAGIWREIHDLRNQLENISIQETPSDEYLPAPLTSTDWDGDARSTTAKTLIDLSAVFGVPAGVKAVYCRLIARDSAAIGTAPTVSFGLSSSTTSGTVWLSVYPIGGDMWVENDGPVACNSDGDIYYQCTASGAGTLEVVLQILGYVQ